MLSRETGLYRQDEKAGGRKFSPSEREKLIKPYLPAPPTSKSQQSKRRPVRDFIKTQLDIFVFTLIHMLFSAYIRLRQTQHALIDRTFAILYYHHRAPELIKQDIKGLGRLPQHLSIVLELKGGERGTTGLEGLIDDVAEVSAWCCCAGIPMLSVYEKTGRYY